MQVKRSILHPTNTVASATSFTHDVKAMRERELNRFAKWLRDFFKDFELLNSCDLSVTYIQKLIDQHGLDVKLCCRSR